MHDEVGDMKVGDSMRNGRIWPPPHHGMDHTTDAYPYVIGYNDTIRAKYQRALNAALRERVDNLVFERFSS
jgi:hypothetical protein